MTVAFVIPAVILVVGLFLIGELNGRRAARYRNMRRAERVRSMFAVARNALVNKALRGEVAVESESFQVFYCFHTAVMRRDDQYGEIWHGVVDAVNAATKRGGPDPLGAERERWDAEMHEISDLTARAIHSILVEYSLMLRVLAPIIRWSHRRARQIESRIEDRVEAIETRRKPERGLVRAFLSMLERSSGSSTCAA